MKQQILDLIDQLKAAVAALPVDQDPSEQIAALQVQVNDLQSQLDAIKAHVVDVEGQLASDEKKLAAIKADLGL